MKTFESKTNALSIHWTDDKIATIIFNVPEKSMNAFSKPILEDLDAALNVVLETPGVLGLIFTSAKPGSFAAGVDISIFDTLKTAQDGKEAAQSLQVIFAKFENANVPTVAAIDGICLGGGLELALSCHYRIAALSESTKLGLPEVQLGLLPGGGGTQRLPRLIGLADSLALILTGKQIDAKKAKKLGLVDEVVPPNQLQVAALKLAREKRPLRRKSTVSLLPDLRHLDMNKLALEGTPMGRALIRKKSLEQVNKNTKGHYPAPVAALESVMWGISRSFDAGLTNEATRFGDLIATSQSRALIHVFQIMTAAKKNTAPKKIQELARKKYIEPVVAGQQPVSVIGAGLMGSGVATVFAQKAIRTVLCDKDASGVARGLGSVTQFFEDKARKKRMRQAARTAAVAHVAPSVEMNAIKNSRVVIEAVYEDLELKHQILAQCESICSPEFIFATNTSSIPVSQIASAAKYQDQVIGMHFFSPVTKMPLVEIIKTPKTSVEVVSATFDLALAMGKNIIVVNDGPGFYTTRILAFLISEALNLISEGASIEDIDAALEKFGMPVGPITLLDEVGIDVGMHIMNVLSQPFSGRIHVPVEVAAISAENRKGRKNNFGFYEYQDGVKHGVDETIYKHFLHKERMRFDRQEIADRCVYVFLNEAARCFDEGVLECTNDGDLGAVFGLGFPPFLGGPFHYAKELGHEVVRSKLLALQDKHGARFAPAEYWQKL